MEGKGAEGAGLHPPLVLGRGYVYPEPVGRVAWIGEVGRTSRLRVSTQRCSLLGRRLWVVSTMPTYGFAAKVGPE